MMHHYVSAITLGSQPWGLQGGPGGIRGAICWAQQALATDQLLQIWQGKACMYLTREQVCLQHVKTDII